MNLAQTIDPEWARSGCSVRQIRVPRPGIYFPPREPITHCKDDPAPPPKNAIAAASRILKVLSVAKRPMSTTKIAAADGGLTTQQVSSNITHLERRQAVTRTRITRGYAYEITQFGRAEL